MSSHYWRGHNNDVNRGRGRGGSSSRGRGGGGRGVARGQGVSHHGGPGPGRGHPHNRGRGHPAGAIPGRGNSNNVPSLMNPSFQPFVVAAGYGRGAIGQFVRGGHHGYDNGPHRGRGNALNFGHGHGRGVDRGRGSNSGTGGSGLGHSHGNQHSLMNALSNLNAADGERGQNGKKKKRGGKSSKKRATKDESKSEAKPLFTFLSKASKDEDIVTLEDDDKSEVTSIADGESVATSDICSDIESISSSVEELEQSLLCSPSPVEEDLTLDEEADQVPTATPGVAKDIGIFWDQENCPVPKHVSTSQFVSTVRAKFCSNRVRELEFTAIHNGKNEKLNLELHELGIECSLSSIGRKNSADDILKDKMSRFVEKHQDNPCQLLLISGDVDFSRDLAKFRFTHKFQTILLHNKNAKETLKSVMTTTLELDEMFYKGKPTNQEPKKEKAAKKKDKSNVKDSTKNANVADNSIEEKKLSLSIETKFSMSVGEIKKFLTEIMKATRKDLSVDFVIDFTSLTTKGFATDTWTHQVQVKVSCGKKKLQRVKCFLENLSSPEDDIFVKCNLDSGESSLSKEELAKKKTVNELKGRMKGLTNSHNARIKTLEVELKTKEEEKSKIGCKKEKPSAKTLLREARSKLNSDLAIINVQDEIKELKDQLQEFLNTCKVIISKITELSSDDSFSSKLSELKIKFAKEVASFENPLPIYKFRKTIQDNVSNNNVTILMAETGSGKSTQVVQYVHDMYPEMTIVCTQPRKIAAVSLAAHVARQMGTSVGGLVGYKVGSQVKVGKDTKVIFMTDQILVNECVKDSNFTKYHCIILDEVHERSINTDLLLGLTKTGIKYNPNLKVVITSATMDEKLFHKHFDDRESKISTMRIPGRTFPIDIVWSNQEVDVSNNYLRATLEKVEEILATTERGDILVFLATPADTDNLANKLKNRNNLVESLQLHGKLQIEEQKKIFERGSKRRVIFSTNCAETSVTVPGIKYVVDPGVVKEKKFDPIKNSSSLVVQKINQSSAKQRAGRAGRTEPGVCHRLYSSQEFNTMNTDMVPEIKRVQLGLTVLKLIDLGISRPDLFPFIESPGLKNLEKSIEDLVNLEALEIETINNNEQIPILTVLGKKMSKLPLEPRLSKLVLTCNDEGSGEDALILASLCSMAGNVFFRMGSDAELTQADQKKINFCTESGDYLTLLAVYKMWNGVGEKQKSKWCVDNFINGKSMKMTRDMANDLKNILQKEMKIKLTNEGGDDSEERMLFSIFKCFRDNLCVYGGHPKFGYINLRTKETLPIHPSSSFSYLGNLTPYLIIYDQILATSRTFLLNLSKVDEDWLNSSELMVSTQEVKSIGPRIMLQSILGRRGVNLKRLEAELKEMIGGEEFLQINCNVKQGLVSWTAHARFHSFIRSFIMAKVNNEKETLTREKLFQSLVENKARPKAVIGSGCLIKDVILEGEFNDIMIKFDPQCEEDIFEDIELYARSLLGFIDCKNLYKTGSKVVIFETFADASIALEKLKEWISETSFNPDNIYPLRTSNNFKRSPQGLELRIRIQRRPFKKFGFINCLDEEDAYKTLNLGSILLPNAITISLQVEKKRNDKKTVYFNLRQYSVIPLNTESLIKDELKKRGLKFDRVFIPVEAPYESKNYEIQQLRAGLLNLFKNAEPELRDNEVEIDIKHPTPKSMTFFARANFLSSLTGMSVGKYLKRSGAQPCYWSQTSEAGGSALIARKEEVDVDFDLITSFSCPRKVFDVLQDSVGVTIEEVSELYPNEKLELTIKDYNKARDNDRAVFSLKGSDLSVIAKAKDALDTILKGETMDHPNIKMLLTPGNIKRLEKMEGDCSVHIFKNMRKGFIIIYGSNSNVNKVMMEINKFLGEIIDFGFNAYFEDMRRHPNGLVKEMLKALGNDFQRLLEMDGVHSVKYLVNIRKVEIISSEEGWKKVKAEIETISKSLSDNPDDEEMCPICFSTPEDDEQVRLNLCGHLYCQGCLSMAMASSNWPLQCAAEDCGANLAVEDFKYLDGESLQKLLKNAFDYMLSNPESSLKPCPSPNCTGVYRKMKDEAENEGFYCTCCGVNICRRCECVYHSGMTCQFFQVYKTDNDHSLKTWLKENPMNRKLCPKCSAPIEKNGGCLHIHCIKCQSHICWKCMGIFNAGSVYTHNCAFQHNPM